MRETGISKPIDKWLPYFLVLFFVVIAIVNAFFVYIAINTHTGVVTENPYQKGLEYNAVLEKSRAQPDIDQFAKYENGILRWTLKNTDGTPIEQAEVTANLVRAIEQGYDTELIFTHKGGGIYEADVGTLPKAGLWIARLKSQWNKKEFLKTYKFIHKRT